MNSRTQRRLETRERVFAAAVEEFGREGMAEADISAITAAAGVARGTFYFHFPTKEHVLAELERREEALMAGRLAAALAGPHDLRFALAQIIREVEVVEERLGKRLLREVLALHFSSARPQEHPEPGRWPEYPVIALAVREFEQARERGEIFAEADAAQSAFLFMVGLYALLITTHDHAGPERRAILGNFTSTVLRGLESR
jgi:TetR/AcrR family transcriptional repressor of uid operon